MMNLFIFNPETDFALAAGSCNYTPPKAVIALRESNSLLPAVFAENNDAILLPGPFSSETLKQQENYSLVKKKNLHLITPEDLDQKSISKIIPWGWNPSLVSFLKEKGINDSLLPTQEYLNSLKWLTHRRTSIKFLNEFFDLKPDSLIPLPIELKEMKDVEIFIDTHHGVFLKAPWSGAGRGIATSHRRNKRQLMEWAKGTIRKQGSIIAEKAFNRIGDFATEWTIKERSAYFLGFSMFHASADGRYHGNIKGSQEFIFNEIKKVAPNFDYNYVSLQKNILDKLISPFYEGPLGIDMLVDNSGQINPCVEINLRYTMGHVSIYEEMA